jgi:hypothetical protein
VPEELPALRIKRELPEADAQGWPPYQKPGKPWDGLQDYRPTRPLSYVLASRFCRNGVTAVRSV